MGKGINSVTQLSEKQMNNTVEHDNSLNEDFLKFKQELKDLFKSIEGNESAKADQKIIDKILKLSNNLVLLGITIASLERERNNLLKLAKIGGQVNKELDTNKVLQVVVDTIIEITSAERSFLMLKNPETNEMELRIGRNWKEQNISKEEFEISHTIISRVAETGEAALTTNAQEDPRYQDQESVIGLSLRSIMCAPLNTKDKVIGVIYVDNRSTSGMFSEVDLALLGSFADQATIALENARLFEDLSNSYDITLEGWASALEYRDQETQEHTKRVTELTLQLATVMGIDEENLVHVRRGAILHDIGKMGIPDAILHKPDSLNAQEREVMESHPQLAFDMLSKIEFLKPALEIPLTHHEKWDGTGYPRGLKGEEIPISARIFAVADVWDALTSDRPYRKAIPKEKAIDYIRGQAGSHFDPKVVKSFLKIVQ